MSQASPEHSYQRAWISPQRERACLGPLCAEIKRKNWDGWIDLAYGPQAERFRFPSLEAVNEAYERICFLLYFASATQGSAPLPWGARFDSFKRELQALSKEAVAEAA